MTRESDYSEAKEQKGIRVTKTSWKGWERIAARLGVSRNEAIERIGRIADNETVMGVIELALEVLEAKKTEQ